MKRKSTLILGFIIASFTILTPLKAEADSSKSLVTKIELFKEILDYNHAKLEKELPLPYSDLEEKEDYVRTALKYQLIPKPSRKNASFQPNLTVTKHYALSKIFQSMGVGVSPFYKRQEFNFTDLNSLSSMAPIAVKAQEIGIIEKDSPEKYKAFKRITASELEEYLRLTAAYLKKTPATPPKVELSITPSKIPASDQELYNTDNFPIFLDVWRNVHENYYYKEDLDNNKLVEGAIKGLVEELDEKYTTYQEPLEADNFLKSLNGEFEGVGMTIEEVEDQIIIISPLKNSPAEKAGLMPNDVIVSVDGENTEGLSPTEVAAKIRGPKGSSVTITVERKGELKNITVIRDKIETSSAHAEMLQKGSSKIAYISIIQFNNESYQTFYQEAKKMLDQGAKGLIIDLRNNPGGYLNVAIDYIDLFFEKPVTAVVVKNSNGKENVIKTKGHGAFSNVKTVILVNQGSASASEIFAGAMQDHKAAKIIGTNSFGKGTVQDVIQYHDDSIFKYTSAIWLTPLKQDINGTGLKPDRYLENSENKDKQLEHAISEF